MIEFIPNCVVWGLGGVRSKMERTAKEIKMEISYGDLRAVGKVEGEKN